MVKRHIPMSMVDSRRSSSRNIPKSKPKILLRTVMENTNMINIRSYMQSIDSESIDTYFANCLSLYEEAVSEGCSEQDKKYMKDTLVTNVVPKIQDIESAKKALASLPPNCGDLCDSFSSIFDDYEVCDRIARNNDKLSKRFNFDKVIQDNKYRSTDFIVKELCSLIDTYNITPKAKFNIALENISYSMYRSGRKTNMQDIVESVVNYFMSRDAVISDRDFLGYINILETSRVLSDDYVSKVHYMFESENKQNTYAAKVAELSKKTSNETVSKCIEDAIKVKTEKDASSYISKTITMMMSEDIGLKDSYLLLKSVYSLPLMGNVSKEFVSSQMTLSLDKAKFKKKMNKLNDKKASKDIRSLIDECNIITASMLLNEEVELSTDKLSPSYVWKEIDPITMLESKDIAETDDIKDALDSFKASQEKSPNIFKRFISTLYRKSPKVIIDGFPHVFVAVRAMVLLAVTASCPLGPVFAAVLALIDMLLQKHIDIKQCKDLLKHLKKEKEKVDTKASKTKDPTEKKKLEEYSDSLKKCIDKVAEYGSKIDDEDEDFVPSGGGDDDFDFDDFNFEQVLEEAYIEEGGLNLNKLKLTALSFKKKFKDLRGKEKEMWKNIDIATSGLYKSLEKAMTNDRREAIIKGSIIPSFSKCIKTALTVGAVGWVTGPIGAAITALGMFGASKVLNERERRLIYDEIDTELQVVEKQIQLADNEGDMNQYRFLLNYQKKLLREKQRIKYGMGVKGRSIPELKARSDS